jgi:ATP-dependent helicase/nuclease subunit B
VEKTSVVIKKLEELAQKGLSPSALTMYIRNPLNYYKRYILNLKESVEVSDALPANIIGTIIHDTMEALYTNYIGKILNIADFKTIETQIEPLTLQFFIKKSFGENAQIDERMITGKNLIIYEIVKKHIKDIVALDKSIVAQGQKLEIIALESHLKAKLPIKNKTVFIRGFVDRIDRLNGRLRITDYKTGKVESRHINLPKKATDLYGLTETETTEKLFQLLTYAWLYYKKGPLLTTDLPLEVGILSTRHIKQGLLKATVYENEQIDVPVIKEFENVLIDLVETMFDPKIPFVDSDSKY